MNRIYTLLTLLLFFYGYTHVGIHAVSNNMDTASILVINPVRGKELGHEKDNLIQSLKDQWQVTKEYNIPATWLFQYGALSDQALTDFAKTEMLNQEFGLLLEIDRTQAQQSGVGYRGQGAWYFSDGLFLISYDQKERRKIIDHAFAKFKAVFGYYPKTVGAWWIGGDSLSYMQKKYGITAALRASDQYFLDFYTIWGMPWSMSYLASSSHEGIPASSFDESSKVVLLPWAQRDPVRGYDDSLFSVQDYMMKNYSNEYILRLADTFLQYPLQTMVFGLENGGTLSDFRNLYEVSLRSAKQLEKLGKGRIELAKDYAERFLWKRQVFPFPPYSLSDDYESGDQSFWYVSGYYRIFIQKIDDAIYLRDVRDYSKKPEEEFTVLPNSVARLFISTPAFLDSRILSADRVTLSSISGKLSVKEDNGSVVLMGQDKKVGEFTPLTMKLYMTDGKKTEFIFSDQKHSINPRMILIGILFLYFIIILFKTRGFRKAVFACAPLIIPITFAASIFSGTETALFDTKEIILFPIAILMPYANIDQIIWCIKLLPLLTLFGTQYFFVAYPDNKILRFLFSLMYCAVTIMYAHVPYFPLERYTGICIALIVISIVCTGGIIAWNAKKFLSVGQRNRIVFVGLPIILCCLLSTFIVSRSRLAFTRYEKDALEYIREKNKDVIYIEQIDYSIKPIYKAVKPLLYEYVALRKFLTGRRWDVVRRPDNHIVVLSDYNNKLIYVPRYLGSDISDYEISTLGLTKIFDNLQIAVYEKDANSK